MSNLVSISDLKQNTATIVGRAAASPQPITITKKSDPTAILVQYDYFQALEEAVMDLADGQEAEKAKSEPTIDLNEYITTRWSKDAS